MGLRFNAANLFDLFYAHCLDIDMHVPKMRSSLTLSLFHAFHSLHQASIPRCG